MPNYQNGKIYKIVSKNTDVFYIGSTCQELKARLQRHEICFRRFKKGKTNYVTSYIILENGEYEIVLIENFPCNSKKELQTQEKHHIKNSELCVNKCVPARSWKEYHEDNKEKRNQDCRNWYIKNKVEKNKKNKKWYYDNNEKALLQKKEYYKNNIDKINKYKKQKHNCECGGKYTTGSKGKHLKTKKHQKFINQ